MYEAGVRIPGKKRWIREKSDGLISNIDFGPHKYMHTHTYTQAKTYKHIHIHTEVGLSHCAFQFVLGGTETHPLYTAIFIKISRN